MTVTGIDQSWGFAKPKAAKRAGVQIVSMYLSHSPSKNITAAKVKAYHDVGIAVLLNWEAMAGAPKNGAPQGRRDALEAVRQAKALIRDVGYEPSSRLSIVFSCDTDVSPKQIKGSVAAYYRAARAVCHEAGFGVGVYGEFDLIEYLAKESITDTEWQTYAWSGGRISRFTDFHQYHNGQTLGGASVDYDRVIHADDVGAWWPRGHKLNTAAGQATEQLDPLEQVMALNPKDRAKLIDDIADAAAHRVWATEMGGGPASQWQMEARLYALRADSKAAGIARVLAAPGTGVLARVSSLQAAVTKLPTAASSITVPAQAVADAVLTKLKSIPIIWKAS